jgi:hypothetical protein
MGVIAEIVADGSMAPVGSTQDDKIVRQINETIQPCLSIPSSLQ